MILNAGRVDITRTEPYRPALPDERDTGTDLEEVRRYAARVAWNFSRNAPMEDVAQDVVERYLKQDPKPDNWKAWTRTVTRNRVVEVMARGFGAHEWQVDGRAGGGDDEHTVTLEDLGASIYGPSAGVLNRDLVAHVLGAVSEDELQIVLEHLNERSNAEIAERHGFASPEVVATKLYRAKQKLRARFPDRDLMLNPQRGYRV